MKISIKIAMFISLLIVRILVALNALVRGACLCYLTGVCNFFFPLFSSHIFNGFSGPSKAN